MATYLFESLCNPVAVAVLAAQEAGIEFAPAASPEPFCPPPLTPADLERIRRAELKRARKAKRLTKDTPPC